MCLYMNVPHWINVERLTAAISATASQLFDVSVVVFLLNCKSSKTATLSAVTSAPLQSLPRECKQMQQPRKQAEEAEEHQQPPAIITNQAVASQCEAVTLGEDN